MAAPSPTPTKPAPTELELRPGEKHREPEYERRWNLPSGSHLTATVLDVREGNARYSRLVVWGDGTRHDIVGPPTVKLECTDVAIRGGASETETIFECSHQRDTGGHEPEFRIDVWLLKSDAKGGVAPAQHWQGERDIDALPAWARSKPISKDEIVE